MATGDLVQKKATGTTDFELIPAGIAGDVVVQKTDGTHEHKSIRNIEEGQFEKLDQMTITEGDDFGLSFAGQLEVGTWDNPREAIIGGGDSTTDTMVGFHTSDDVNYTDITNIIASDVGSTTGLFGGTAENETIYIGADFPFSGVKVKIDTDGVLDPDNICAEYWGSSSWQDVSYMATRSSLSPFLQNNFGWFIAQNNLGSEQWYFNFNPYQNLEMWNQSTVNGVTKYWARFRICDIAGITTDPIVEQIKLHGNAFEANETGIAQRKGYSRRKKTILSGVSNLINNTSETPRNQDIQYAPDVTADRYDNKLRDSNADSLLFVLNIPEGVDTSIPIEVSISYYPNSNVAGDLEIQLTKIPVQDGFLYDGSAAEEGLSSSVDTLPAPAQSVRRTIKCYIDIRDATTDFAYMCVIRRDATAGNLNDTLASNITLSHIVVEGYEWLI